MTNDFGIPLSEAFRSRFDTFFHYNHPSLFYKFLKTIFIIVFCIPMPIVSILEFLVLSTFKTIGLVGEKTIGCLLGVFWLPFGFLLGLVYMILSYFFYFLFAICILPDFMYKCA